MLKLERRRVVVSLAVAAAAVLALLAFIAAWPYFKYPSATARMAAEHFDMVTVKGFDYLGEDVSNYGAVSRFWIGRDASNDSLSIRYDGRPLRQDHPGRDSLSRSQFEVELGWLSLPDEGMPCGLKAYQIRKINTSTGLDVSGEDKRAVEGGAATLIRIVVNCGRG